MSLHFCSFGFLFVQAPHLRIVSFSLNDKTKGVCILLALVGLCNVQLSLVQKAKKKSWLQNETQHTLENTILFCCNGGLLFLMQSACFCSATKPCKNWLGFLEFIVDHYNTNPPSYMCLHKFSFHKERWREGSLTLTHPQLV